MGGFGMGSVISLLLRPYKTLMQSWQSTLSNFDQSVISWPPKDLLSASEVIGLGKFYDFRMRSEGFGT